MRRLDRARAIVVLCSAVSFAGACAEDRILSVDSVCGDGVKNSSEECDVASEGCVKCHVQRGFECTDEGCASICGDGDVVGSEECDPPNGITCDSECRSGEKSEACDMTGYWIDRHTAFSIDSVLSQVQTSSDWYVFHIIPSTDGFQVEYALNCGVQVTGSASVALDNASLRALVQDNPQGIDRPAPRVPRRVTFTAVGEACSFAMDRHYLVRGGSPDLLPPDFSTKPDLATLTPLPYEDDPQHPTGAHLDGALDIDGDGHPGILYRITGNANGNRSVIQRDWNEYYTDPNALIPAHAIEFVAGMHFDNQENILYVTQCPLVGCGILLAGSKPAPALSDRVVFRYLGKTLDDPRVSQIVVAPLKENLETDVQTCANARAALPHDPAKE